jgi:glycosyltransferase involved in cell wall biosynthesis
MTLAVLMPVFDESSRLARTLVSLRDDAGVPDVTVFVVDDGSAEPVTIDALPACSDTFHVVLARHAVNLGQGAALETARQLALRDGAHDVFVTMDSDGQHSAADVAFGNRFLGRSDVPMARRWLLSAALWFERALTGLDLADAHNGMRAFSRRALEQTRLRQNRMAHATEIKQRVARTHDLVVVEVPVTIRYLAETRKKGQRATGAAAILRDLVGLYLFGDAR